GDVRQQEGPREPAVDLQHGYGVRPALRRQHRASASIRDGSNGGCGKGRTAAVWRRRRQRAVRLRTCVRVGQGPPTPGGWPGGNLVPRRRVPHVAGSGPPVPVGRDRIGRVERFDGHAPHADRRADRRLVAAAGPGPAARPRVGPREPRAVVRAGRRSATAPARVLRPGAGRDGGGGRPGPDRVAGPVAEPRCEPPVGPRVLPAAARAVRRRSRPHPPARSGRVVVPPRVVRPRQCHGATRPVCRAIM
ncbi:MAG: hypothetical protein AVDCRST_MAG64-1073, partial [uncultured Phycisphaerae bacterium]